MSDPINAREFRLPSGEIMWIEPAAVDAAHNEGESNMRGKQTVVGQAELMDAPKDGLYQIGRGFFRFKAGDKIPSNAKYFESGSAPKVSTVGRNRAAAERAAKSPTRRGGAENAKGAGASETTQDEAPKE